MVRGRGEEEGPGRPIRLCAQAKRTRASSWPKLHNPTPPKLGLHQNNINPTKSYHSNHRNTLDTTCRTLIGRVALIVSWNRYPILVARTTIANNDHRFAFRIFLCLIHASACTARNWSHFGRRHSHQKRATGPGKVAINLLVPSLPAR